MRLAAWVGILSIVLSGPLVLALGPPEPHADAMPLVDTALGIAPAAPACAEGPEDTAFRVLYVLPPATLDQHTQRVHLVRAGIAEMTAIVLASSLPFGVDVRIKFYCDAEGEIPVPKVRTSTPSNVATFNTITSELRAMGFNKPHEKYLVAYEGLLFGCGGCVGQATAFSDDRPHASNLNNVGDMFAILYVGNYGPIRAPTATFTNVMLHEASHTMGAVQLSAPHTSGAFHCDDGTDIMCYADGSPGSAYTPLACPRLVVTWVGPEMPYDCGNDDYFHPAPAEGSYLATHWNLGSPANAFTLWRRV